MDQETKNRIFQNIGVLENNPEISPFEAENIYIDILTPLLEEEGYKVTQTASTRDSGIDFTAQNLPPSYINQIKSVSNTNITAVIRPYPQTLFTR